MSLPHRRNNIHKKEEEICKTTERIGKEEEEKTEKNVIETRNTMHYIIVFSIVCLWHKVDVNQVLLLG